MKVAFQTIILGAIFVVALPAKAQGTITFGSFFREILYYNPFEPNQWGVPPGPNFRVGLFLSSDLANPLATSTFLDGTGYISVPENDVVVPGHPVNSTAEFVVQVWPAEGPFEGEVWGRSSPFLAGPLGGSNDRNPPTFSPDIINMESFGIYLIPEPSIFALASVGFCSIFLHFLKSRRDQ